LRVELGIGAAGVWALATVAQNAANPKNRCQAHIPSLYGSANSGVHRLAPEPRGAVCWYKKAFGATEIMRMVGLDGKSIMHAEIKIGDSIVFLGDAMPGQSVAFPKGKERPTASIHLYVADVDAAYKRAVDAGAKSLMGPPKDMFWGDRYAHLIDPYGHHWGIATHKEDVSEAEMRKRGQVWMKEMAAKKAKK
jgi:uncharacterized glyoxalase superfamily protein PhnB